MPMFPRIPVIPGETLTSWAARAARVQTGFTLPRFLALTESDRMSIHSVVDEQRVRHLGELLGGQYEDLAPIAWLQRPEGMILHRGQIFHKSLLRRASTAFCPLCLLEDGEQKYDRALWHLSVSVTCIRHKVPLVLQPAVNRCLEAFLPELAFPTDTDLRNLARSPSVLEPSKLQTYIARRLEGYKQCSVLDSLHLGEVARCVSILAEELVREKATSRSSADPAELGTARDIAFEALAIGEAGLTPLLSRIMRHSANLGPCSTPARTLGRLYTLVKRGGEASALRLPMRAFLLDRLPFAAGDEILGTTVPARIRHSLLTLKATTRLTKGTLAFTFQWLEPLHPDENLPPESMVFDSNAAEEAVSKVTGSIRLEALSEWIGCDKTTARDIIASGLVEQIAGTARWGDVTPRPRITLCSVDALFKSLSDVSTRLVHAKPGLNTMIGSAKSHRWPVDRIMRLALAGTIDLYQLIGREGFQSFLVDQMQVLLTTRASPLDERMTKQEAASAIQVDIQSIEKLMRYADNSGYPYIRRVVPLSGPQHHRHLVSKLDFDQFVADHVSIGCLAAELGKPRGEVAADIQLRGISPIPCHLTAENQIFRRADL